GRDANPGATVPTGVAARPKGPIRPHFAIMSTASGPCARRTAEVRRRTSGRQSLMCTRALWADAGGAVLAGRNMDWMEEPGTNLWAFPRGMARDDGLDGTLAWTSAYGSLVAGAHDL